MTTLSLPLVPAGKAHPHPLNVVRAELTKFRSLRSSYWSIAATAVVTIGLAVVVTQSTVGSVADLSPAEQASFDGTSKSLSGLLLGQLAIGVLGVLAIPRNIQPGSSEPAWPQCHSGARSWPPRRPSSVWSR